MPPSGQRRTESLRTPKQHPAREFTTETSDVSQHFKILGWVTLGRDLVLDGTLHWNLELQIDQFAMQWWIASCIVIIIPAVPFLNGFNERRLSYALSGHCLQPRLRMLAEQI